LSSFFAALRFCVEELVFPSASIGVHRRLH